MKGLVVIAKQRTGTNFLRSLLAQSSDARDCGEIFHTETLKAPGNFFAWLGREKRAFPAIRSEQDVRRMFLDYLGFLEERFPVPLLDIKYNSLWALAPTWVTPLDLPVVLKVLNQRGYGFVHLRRLNRLDYAMSHLLAARTGVFVAREAVEIAEKYEIDPERVAAMMQQYEREQKFVGRYFNRLRRSTDLAYETLAGAGPEERERILRGLVEGTDISFRRLGEPRTQKILRDWRENVSNLAAIEARFGPGG